MATILIVDDSQFQRSFQRRALTPAGHRVLEAGGGREALEIVAAERPDCVLADLIMPETRGLSLLETLSAAEPDLPVVVVTADIQDQVRRQCLEAGAFAVLHKPVDEERLRQTVAAALAGAGAGA